MENEVEVKAEGAEQDFEEVVQGLRDQADLLENPPVSEPSPTQEDTSTTATVVLSPAEVVAEETPTENTEDVPVVSDEPV